MPRKNPLADAVEAALLKSGGPFAMLTNPDGSVVSSSRAALGSLPGVNTTTEQRTSRRGTRNVSTSRAGAPPPAPRPSPAPLPPPPPAVKKARPGAKAGPAWTANDQNEYRKAQEAVRALPPAGSSYKPSVRRPLGPTVLDDLSPMNDMGLRMPDERLKPGDTPASAGLAQTLGPAMHALAVQRARDLGGPAMRSTPRDTFYPTTAQRESRTSPMVFGYDQMNLADPTEPYDSIVPGDAAAYDLLRRAMRQQALQSLLQPAWSDAVGRMPGKVASMAAETAALQPSTGILAAIAGGLDKFRRSNTGKVQNMAAFGPAGGILSALAERLGSENFGSASADKLGLGADPAKKAAFKKLAENAADRGNLERARYYRQKARSK